MGIDPASVAGGAIIGAIASDAYDKAKDAATPEAVVHDGVETAIIMELVAELHEYTKRVEAQRCKPQFVKVPLPVSPTPGADQPNIPGVYTVKRLGYNHVSLWTTTASLKVAVHSDVGPAVFTMNVGWNAFDVPEGALVWLDSGTATTVILYYGESSLDITGV